MPIFEFKCNDCGHLFSKLVWNSSTDCEIECPKCKSVNTEKMISNFASITQASSTPSAPPCSASSCGSGFS